jgi:hypothetical protein
MIRGGRRAFFGDFGLHKTVTQLEVIGSTARTAPGCASGAAARRAPRIHPRRRAFFTGATR